MTENDPTPPRKSSEKLRERGSLGLGVLRALIKELLLREKRDASLKNKAARDASPPPPDIVVPLRPKDTPPRSGKFMWRGPDGKLVEKED